MRTAALCFHQPGTMSAMVHAMLYCAVKDVKDFESWKQLRSPPRFDLARPLYERAVVWGESAGDSSQQASEGVDTVLS